MKIELSTHSGRISRGPYIVVLSSMFPSGLSVLSQHCHGSHKTLGGPCAKGSFVQKNKQYRRPADRQALLESKHLVNKMLKDAHNRYIEEILGITNPIGTGPRSAVGNMTGNRCESDSRSRGREFDPGLVPYFRGD